MPHQTDLTQAILEQQEVWDIVDESKPELTIVAQIRKKDKNNIISLKIIKQGVNSDLYININGKQNFNQSWEILCRVCSQVSQSVVYLIFKKLFN